MSWYLGSSLKTENKSDANGFIFDRVHVVIFVTTMYLIYVTKSNDDVHFAPVRHEKQNYCLGSGARWFVSFPARRFLRIEAGCR